MGAQESRVHAGPNPQTRADLAEFKVTDADPLVNGCYVRCSVWKNGRPTYEKTDDEGRTFNMYYYVNHARKDRLQVKEWRIEGNCDRDGTIVDKPNMFYRAKVENTRPPTKKGWRKQYALGPQLCRSPCPK